MEAAQKETSAKTAKPFSWVVRFTVAPAWIQDGFTLTNERARDMLASEVSSAHGDEIEAVVLEAPSALQICRMQGYHAKHVESGKVVRGIIAATPNAGNIHRALIAARRLLDSVAFVADEGDTGPVIGLIDRALADIDARQGEDFYIED